MGRCLAFDREPIDAAVAILTVSFEAVAHHAFARALNRPLFLTQQSNQVVCQSSPDLIHDKCDTQRRPKMHVQSKIQNLEV